MKKYFLIGLTVFIFGCEPDEQKVESEEIESFETRIVSEEVEILEGAYLAEDIEVDVTGDGEEDKILLYISPPPIFDDNGNAAWDDTHIWQLLVKDEEESYALFNGDVRGTLDFWIIEKENRNEIILLSDGQSLMMYRYKFDKDGFDKEEILLEDSNIVKRSLSEW
ncbi:hypothetical protein AM499_05040 [Bacillus sp. FJAT-22090]|uniref:hypothetical protein n=1 Tax=Bacillus sp. FJAT-22090 TaxID=1581038 RepID=UPI0006AE4087|nr:hypothetical protein [Bacillus sp. FJAT-22090]ALC85252.1 hypothetical protein AM499_05040 [Bacillus sp. FJAT-22090]